jgi:Phage gp6-like head-tail connector protein
MENKIKFNAIYAIGINEEDPFSLAEVKQYLKIDSTDEDALIEQLIAAAKLSIEKFTNLSLTTKKIRCHLNNSLGNIYLPLGPATSLISVENLQEVAYENANQANGLLLSPCEDDLIVQYEVKVDKLPADLKVYCMQQVAYLYEHRGDEELGDISPVIKSALISLRKNNY